MKSEKDILKIKNTLLYLLNKYNKEIDYITVFKLLYLAQKKHLKIYGLPIFKDDFYAFSAGPAPSITYNICKIVDGVVSKNSKIYKELKPYSDFIEIITKEKGEREIKYIKTDKIAETIRLSKSNIKILDEVYERYHKYSPSKLSTITHDSAWHKNWDENKPDKIKIIPLSDIAQAAGVSKALLEYITD
ncbi:putative phage-associated protein [Dysgonomonas alginatilytica]|uniref:Putative phage-associated protein n=1 Tax=Dysgonomonas alginatilytica TaxID=1605892 RepID=A0A2V3PJ27_9BACT|nr:Panacea domain-containing protein [Dysgonomonas alginatilytica]PXV60157.1 putative phage-associated protein [Dysgonomonas alginatilytica]